MTTSQIDTLASECASDLVRVHFDYDTLAVRIMVSNLHKDTLKTFSAAAHAMYTYVNEETNEVAPMVSRETDAFVRAHTRELDAATMNLVAWQVAGASRTVPRAMAYLHGNSGASGPILGYHTESWNTYGTGMATGSTGTPAPLSATRIGTGNYRMTYRTHFPDEAGATGVFLPRFAVAHPQGTTGVVGPTTSVTGPHVFVRLARANGSGLDAGVLVQTF